MGYRGSKSAKPKSIVASLFSALFPYIFILTLSGVNFCVLLFSNYYYGLLVIFPSYSVQNKSVAVRLFNITKFSSASTLWSKAFGLSVINYSTDSSGVPVKVYSNADIQKLQIIKENRSRSGIYR